MSFAMTIIVTQTRFPAFITPYLEPTIIYFNGAEGEALNSMTKDERGMLCDRSGKS